MKCGKWTAPYPSAPRCSLAPGHCGPCLARDDARQFLTEREVAAGLAPGRDTCESCLAPIVGEAYPYGEDGGHDLLLCSFCHEDEQAALA